MTFLQKSSAGFSTERVGLGRCAKGPITVEPRFYEARFLRISRISEQTWIRASAVSHRPNAFSIL